MGMSSRSIGQQANLEATGEEEDSANTEAKIQQDRGTDYTITP